MRIRDERQKASQRARQSLNDDNMTESSLHFFSDIKSQGMIFYFALLFRWPDLYNNMLSKLTLGILE